jgi:hypothetical protein
VCQGRGSLRWTESLILENLGNELRHEHLFTKIVGFVRIAGLNLIVWRVDAVRRPQLVRSEVVREIEREWTEELTAFVME